MLKDGLEIDIKGKQISKPYIDMTIDIMGYFGVEVENVNYQKYSIKPQQYQAKDYTVETDYSSAAYFFAINALTGSKIRVEGLNPDSKQADKKFADMVKDGFSPGHINMEDCPDQAMTMAVLAAFNTSETTLDGVATLRIKETERVKAVENELAKMGIAAASTPDSLTILGGKPKGTLIDTYGDHRIAMSFAVAGTKIPGIQIHNPTVVNKTFPGFWDELAKIARVKPAKKEFSNILLIGMRGSGKTTTGSLLAKEIGKDFIDMDLYLEEKHGQKVRDIVLENGWEHFRKLETEACRELSKRANCVISSGGGIVLDQTNMDLFKPDSLAVLLRADGSRLSKRIKNDKNRPELSSQPSLLGELDEVWEKRKNKYYKNADFIIDTDNVSPKQAVNAIMEKLS
jgi:shikimate kinase